MPDENENRFNMKNLAKNPISKQERLRRAALRMRNQQPETIANNRMKMQVYWLIKKGIIKIPA
jgi:hypothetical protein